jgi:hypothetical protein
MNSLRDMMETTFAAAAFAERNLPQEARECAEERLRQQSVNANACPKAPAKRQRPSLKA